MTNQKSRLLITAPPILPHYSRYSKLLAKHNIQAFSPPFKVQESLSEKQLLGLVTDIDAILCGDDQITEKVLSTANKLKVISKWGTGVDSIDVDYAKARGISVKRVKDVFAAPVSDTVMAYILNHCRSISEKDALVRAERWEKVPSFTMSEKVIGVIGVGHIGKAIVQKCAAFGCKILGYDTKPIEPSFCEATGLEQTDLKTLLSSCDYISLNCDLNEESFHILNSKTFKSIKKGVFIINTARGPLIHEDALIEAINTGVVAGAALDVFEVEPLPLNSELRNLEQVYLSPHNSNGSPMVFELVDQKSLQNVIDELYRIGA